MVQPARQADKAKRLIRQDRLTNLRDKFNDLLVAISLLFMKSQLLKQDCGEPVNNMRKHNLELSDQGST